MLLRRLMLVIHMTGNAARRRSGKRVMARIMPDYPAGNGTADAAFGIAPVCSSQDWPSGNERAHVKKLRISILPQ